MTLLEKAQVTAFTLTFDLNGCDSHTLILSVYRSMEKAATAADWNRIGTRLAVLGIEPKCRMGEKPRTLYSVYKTMHKLSFFLAIRRMLTVTDPETAASILP